ncbi:hypothetical protein SAMN05661096_00553 [Marivirga sericea]|uniref:Uncharacterized protein n=1 Tax=Marivirga sericea TaxID=1028 RepID=A0A1X7IFC1_9BACT|nr:hypothetical protein [Marivirga sericea]SMG12891.1 hypothetical protein SAMN05661096_00553 [Marivirga sericea]
MYFKYSLKYILQTFFPSSVSLLLLIFSLLIVSYNSQSQTVENVTATVKGDIIIVSYDLVSTSDELFNINLYSSKDNFEKPLALVTGDVGPNIANGKEKNRVVSKK